MPIVNPTYPTGAGVNFVYAGLGTLIVNKGLAYNENYAGRGTMSVRGQPNYDSYGALEVRGQAQGDARAILLIGLSASSVTLGGGDIGIAQRGEGYGSLEAREQANRAARATLEVADSGGILGEGKVRPAYLGVDIGSNPIGVGRLSLVARAQASGISLASLQQRTEDRRAAAATLEIETQAQSPALYSGDFGTLRESLAPVSQEIETAEGLEVIVDVVDATVDTSKGDVC